MAHARSGWVFERGNKPGQPPGPRGLFWLGTALAMSRDPLSYLFQLGRNYGPLSYSRIAGLRYYSINDPALIEEVLVGRHRDCIKDWTTRELIPLVGHGLLTSEGTLWQKRRKLAAPPLQPRRTEVYGETMVACAQRAFSSWGDGPRADLSADLSRLTLQIVGQTLLGVDTERDAAKVSDALDVVLAHYAARLYSLEGLVPQSWPTPSARRFRRAVSRLDEVVFGIIARARLRAGGDDLLWRLLHARTDEGEGLGDEALRDEAITMLLAGHETTALALCYALILLCRNDAALRSLQRELHEVVGDRVVGVEDLPRLRYLDAVLRETLRLYPPAYIIGREVIHGFSLGGFPLTPGAQLIFCPLVLQRDPAFFPEPERFSPERWLDGSTDGLPRFAYFPFGGGPRVCIGNHFARMEAALVLASLLQRFEPSLPGDFQLRLRPSVTLRFHGPLPITLRARSTRR